MTRKDFGIKLKVAWAQYQDLYDRHMRLLRALGEASGLDEIHESYETQIEYALQQWSTPKERFETGGFDDFGLDLDIDGSGDIEL